MYYGIIFVLAVAIVLAPTPLNVKLFGVCLLITAVLRIAFYWLKEEPTDL